MPILGGSPLGLIGVTSGPTKTGMSTFNGGKSRNINVNLYNAGREADKTKLKRAGLNTKSGAFSVFSGGSAVKPWPNVGKSGKEQNAGLGLDDDYNGVTRRTLHNNDIYDTSILNIVEKTANSAAALRPSDFAYLKNLGVYPNNRLIVCRRFSGPQIDNVFGIKGSPISVLVSWRPPGDDFLDISFGEEWIAADADFTSIVNGIGQDILKMSPLGNAAGEMFNAIPLPGWSETLQRMVLEKLGVYEKGAGGKRLPAGNPNLIKEAKRRKTIGQGEAGSGLSCKCSIKVTVEYEQKFISGIDPTIVYMDILQNALRFATSVSDNYGLSGQFGSFLIQAAANPSLIINKVVEALRTALETVKKTVMDFLNEFAAEAKATKESAGEGGDEEGGEPGEKSQADIDKEKKKAEEEYSIAEKALKLFDEAFAAIGKSLSRTVSKYQEAIRGVVYALTGMASTPWHVTLGNPLRPIFCSGDMLCTGITLTMGSTLAFNDLPANIKLDFTLENARPWGLQEIMAKFNTGNIRTVNIIKDVSMLTPSDALLEGAYIYATQSGENTTNGSTKASNTPGGSTPNGESPSTTTQPVSKEGNDQKTINSNPNSSDPVVQDNSTKTVIASLVGSVTYLDNSDGSVKATATFLVNNDKEITGIGVAPSNGSTKDVQKQSASELAKNDAIKKYK